MLRGGDLEVTEETTNPSSENPEHDENEQGGTDVVHDGLEVTRVLGTLNKGSSTTDERVTGSSSDNTVGLATLATGGVVTGVGHVFVDSERLTSDSGLITSNEGDTLVNINVILIIITVLLLEGIIGGVGEVLLVGLEHLGLGVVTDQTDIGRDNGTLLDDNDVTSNELTGEDLLLLTVTDNDSTHSNITLERSHDVGSLLLLVPTDESVEQKNTTDNTEIDPVTETGSEEDSKFHN
jgi:hypothetical protein